MSQSRLFVASLALIAIVAVFVGAASSSTLNAQQLFKNVKIASKQLPSENARLSYAASLLSSMDETELVHLLAEALAQDDCDDNCIFGTLTAKRLLFVIDVSPSMKTPFKLTSGRSLTRLQYVKEQLVDLFKKQLTPDRLFQVFSFDGGLYPMWSRFGNATQTNIDFATNWVNNLNSPNGGTDIYKALSAAFQAMGPSYPESSAIFLLSDGNPSSGITNITEIAAAVQKWSHTALPPIPVHTFSFTAGNIKDVDPSYTEDKELSRLCMREIADASGGVYHAYE